MTTKQNLINQLKKRDPRDFRVEKPKTLVFDTLSGAMTVLPNKWRIESKTVWHYDADTSTTKTAVIQHFSKTFVV